MKILNLSSSPIPEPETTRGSVFFIGTATVILRFGDFVILTDPNFLHAGDHAHLGYGIKSERLTNPAIDIEQLPPLDFCLLSHYHGDHFDRIAEEKLRKDLPVITTRHAADELESRGFTATLPLETWETVVVHKDASKLTVTAMPGKHGQGMIESLMPPVMGSMLELASRTTHKTFRMYISGDTLIHDDLREIPKKYPDVNIALLHLGGTKIMGILLTMDDQQGVEAVRIINPREVIPIHFNDYEVFRSPLEDFIHSISASGINNHVTYLNHGDSYEFGLY